MSCFLPLHYKDKTEMGLICNFEDRWVNCRYRFAIKAIHIFNQKYLEGLVFFSFDENTTFMLIRVEAQSGNLQFWQLDKLGHFASTKQNLTFCEI